VTDARCQAQDQTAVCAVTAELPTSPGFQVRALLPASALRDHGVDVTPMTLLSVAEGQQFERARTAMQLRLVMSGRRRLRSRLDQMRQRFAVALIYRRADLLPSLALERAAMDDHRLVFDVDDAIWLDGQRGTGTRPLARLKGSARKAHWLAARADHVIAGNTILAEQLSEFSDVVTVIPSMVDTASIPLIAHTDRSEVTLCWIGSRSTARFLEAIRPTLGRLARAVADVRLRLLIVGGSMAPIDGVRIEQEPWSEQAQRRALAQLDIGLMPLRDTPWNRGKCAYKALLYMAAGAPVVADDVGIARQVIGHDRAGYVVRGEEEWTEALVALTRDHTLRQRLGRAGRARVERDFSVVRWVPKLAALLSGLG